MKKVSPSVIYRALECSTYGHKLTQNRTKHSGEGRTRNEVNSAHPSFQIVETNAESTNNPHQAIVNPQKGHLSYSRQFESSLYQTGFSTEMAAEGE